MSHKKDARLIWVNNTVMILSQRSRYCTDLDGKNEHKCLGDCKMYVCQLRHRVVDE